jgi:predicted restriction endonuclease
MGGAFRVQINIAGHIKPWCDSNQYEKVDVNNGLLLAPQYDLLFDKGLISFNPKGEVIKAKELEFELINEWRLDYFKLIAISCKTKSYMKYHRAKFGFEQ